MSTQRPNPITRDTVERLLDGDRSGHDALARVLAAAATTARPQELAGESACIAAFRAARLVPATRPRRQSMIKSAVMKLLTVKAAAIVAGAAATGGVALAASSGALPGIGGDKPAVSASTSAGHGKSDAAKEQAEAAADKSKSANDKDGPSPSFVGLCRAYSAGNKTEQGKALESPAFTALITAAGGKDKVAAYCVTVLASAKPDPAKSHPSGQGDTDHPQGVPSERPKTETSVGSHGKPTDSPTG
jgi:hypothetical protein